MKAIKQIGKMIAAGMVALIILTLIISVYDTNPLRKTNPQGNTDYVWEPNALWVNMSEGVSFGKMDSAGFNNLQAIEHPDILLLGSSHMQAKNVNQNENAAYILSERFHGKYTVYNMGMSGHTLYKTCQYLPQSLAIYEERMPRYVIIETDEATLTEKGIDAILQHTIPKSQVYETGITAILQKNAVFRKFYHQLDAGMMDILLPELKGKTASSEQANAAGKNSSASSAAPYDRLTAYLAQLQEQYGTQIIVMFHPFEQLQKDGSVRFAERTAAALFADAAAQHGIVFVDMAERFQKMYDEEYHLPHGFITGEIGDGHLNVYGHAAVAEAIYDAIGRLEG